MFFFFFVCCCCGGGGGGGGDKNVRFPLISPDFNSFSLLSQFSFSLSLFLSLSVLSVHLLDFPNPIIPSSDM